MTNGDHVLLEALSAALTAEPFAPQVNVHGALMSREVARSMEAQLLRARVAERRAA